MQEIQVWSLGWEDPLEKGMATHSSILFYFYPICFGGFPGISDDKESACNAADLGLIPGSGRSPEEANGNPLQHSCLENPMNRGAWRVTVHGVFCPWGYRVGHDLTTNTFTFTEWPSGFHYFLQFEPEFCNKELMIWATGSSRSCFCLLCRASPPLAAKNITNLISVLTIWWSPCVESSTGLPQ